MFDVRLYDVTIQGGRGVQAARSVASGGSGSMFGDEMFEEEENPCTVCLGELETGSTSKLDCGHIYHTEVCSFIRTHLLPPTVHTSSILTQHFVSCETV